MFIVLNLEMYFILATKNFMKIKLVNHKYSIRSRRMTFKYDGGGCFLMGSGPRRGLDLLWIYWMATYRWTCTGVTWIHVCLFVFTCVSALLINKAWFNPQNKCWKCSFLQTLHLCRDVALVRFRQKETLAEGWTTAQSPEYNVGS